MRGISLIYNTSLFWNRICMPVEERFISNTNISNVIQSYGLEKYLSDLKDSWPVLLIVSFVAFFLSIIYIGLLTIKNLTGAFIWLGIGLYFVMLTLLATFFL